MNATNCWENASKLIANGEASKAMELCETEPCSGSLECQNYLGWAYYARGEMETASNWFIKAADKEDGEALFGMGSVHTTLKDFPLALSYFERAANQGYIRGYQWIAGIYQHGCGVPTDINKAINYYQKGAAQGYIMSERSLISLASQRGNILVKISSLLKLIRLQIKTAKIASRNINDPRLADVKKKPIG